MTPMMEDITTSAGGGCRNGEPMETTYDRCSPEPSAKRVRRSPNPTPPVTEDPLASGPVAAADDGPLGPIAHWVREGHWPTAYFERDHVLAQKRSLVFPRQRRSCCCSATYTTPSDQKPREEKSAPYWDPRYETLLMTKGSFMGRSNLDITDESKALCNLLLENRQPIPENTLFRDDVFALASEKIRNKNEARIIQDISRLIVPSAESLAILGAKHLEVLIESVNEGWNNSNPLTIPRPQPDYSVGFRREAFTEDQLAKLSPLIGDFIAGDLSLFMATYYMYFPFLSSEVKCGTAALDVADRQNAHTMTFAARAVAELLRLVGREDEIDRQILAFSVSHDNRSVRIYGCYPVIEGKKSTKYYRHLIHTFDITALDGKEKWTAYQFTRNVYDTWMPKHFEKICSAIDQLPADLGLDVASSEGQP